MTKLASIVVACSMLAACGPRLQSNKDAGTGSDDSGPVLDAPHTLTSIEVTPTNLLVELDLGSAGAQGFTATARYADGVDEDITALATWEITNPAIGTLNGSTLAIPARNVVSVESSRVRATHAGLVGEAQITVAAYRKSGAMQDFFFVLPYTDPTGPKMKPLEFGTEIPALDVFFLMDTTGSMIGEITNLQNGLSSTIVPGIQAQIPNTQFGVAAYEDFPVDPYGALAGSACGRGGLPTPDQPLHLFQTITSNISAVQAAVGMCSTGSGPIGCGADTPESTIEALYQVATGSGLSGPGATNVPAHSGGVGGVAFRAGTMPVIVTITDAVSHAPGESGVCTSSGEPVDYGGAVAAVAHTRAQTKAALAGICARTVGVATIDPDLTLDCTGQPDLEDFATSTGARVPPAAWDVSARPAGCAADQCCTNYNGSGRAPDADGLCPLVFRTDPNGTGLGGHIVTGIQMLTRFATFDVTSERTGGPTAIDGTPLPAPHTTADFIKQIVPTGFMLPPAPPVVPAPTFDATTFFKVTPKTRVSFSVQALNDFVPQTDQPQVFRAVIRVLAGGCTPLDQREVLVLVPPNPIVLQ